MQGDFRYIDLNFSKVYEECFGLFFFFFCGGCVWKLRACYWPWMILGDWKLSLLILRFFLFYYCFSFPSCLEKLFE